MLRFLCGILFFCTSVVLAQNKPLIKEVEERYPVENAEQFATLAPVIKQLLSSKNNAVMWPSAFYQTLKSAQYWTNRHGTARQKLLSDYYLLLFYDNNLDDDKAIAVGKKLLQSPQFMELPESTFALAALNSSYRRKGFYRQQLDILSKLMIYNRKFGYPVWPKTYAYYDQMGIIYYRLGQYDLARTNFIKQAALFRKSDDLFRTSSMINNVGLTYARQHQSDSARSNYRRALALIENSTITDRYYSPAYIAHFKNVIAANIAENQMNLGYYDDTETAFKRELFSSKAMKEFSTTALSYQKIARLYYLTGQYHLAHLYNDSTLNFEKKFYNPSNRQKALQLKAKILLKEKKVDSALIFMIRGDYLKDSLIQEEASRNFSEAASKFNFAQSEIALKKNQELLKQKEKISLLQWFITGVIICILILIAYLFFKARKSNRIITAQQKALSKILNKKEIMLDEIQHRIKNNLQMMTGILEFQKQKKNAIAVGEVLRESQEYLQSMLLIQELLYAQHEMAMLDMQGYFEKMTDFLLIGHPSLRVERSIAANVHLRAETVISLGLLVCELIMNSLKHAFLNSGKISIKMMQKGTNYQLIYADNGIGYEQKEEPKLYGTGMKLIFMLAEDMNGRISFLKGQGFAFQLDF